MLTLLIKSHYLKLLFSILFIFTMLTSPILEKLPFVCENESTEVVDFDSDNETEEETIEFEDKIVEYFCVSLKQTIGTNKLTTYPFVQDFTKNFNREIHTPPPEFI